MEPLGPMVLPQGSHTRMVKIDLLGLLAGPRLLRVADRPRLRREALNIRARHSDRHPHDACLMDLCVCTVLVRLTGLTCRGLNPAGALARQPSLRVGAAGRSPLFRPALQFATVVGSAGAVITQFVVKLHRIAIRS